MIFTEDVVTTMAGFVSGVVTGCLASTFRPVLARKQERIQVCIVHCADDRSRDADFHLHVSVFY